MPAIHICFLLKRDFVDQLVVLGSHSGNTALYALLDSPSTQKSPPSPSLHLGAEELVRWADRNPPALFTHSLSLFVSFQRSSQSFSLRLSSLRIPAGAKKRIVPLFRVPLHLYLPLFLYRNLLLVPKPAAPRSSSSNVLPSSKLRLRLVSPFLPLARFRTHHKAQAHTHTHTYNRSRKTRVGTRTTTSLPLFPVSFSSFVTSSHLPLR